jgi:hypothetical protein
LRRRDAGNNEQRSDGRNQPEQIFHFTTFPSYATHNIAKLLQTIKARSNSRQSEDAVAARVTRTYSPAGSQQAHRGPLCGRAPSSPTLSAWWM